MNIGILSMQKVMNYGSFLQGFALKRTLENLGHYCEFIDIEQGKIFPELKRTPFFLLKKGWERYCKRDILARLRYTRLFQKRFSNEFFEELGVNRHTLQYFDVVVIGSDEVFNFAQRVPWGYTPQLYGKVSKASKVISYAGSFGHTTLEDIYHFGVGEEIASALSVMSAISVRDVNSFDIVKRIVGREAHIDIDPVLLFDYKPYIRSISRKDYIIVYSYPNRIKKKEEIIAIKKFAKKYNKKLISIGFYFPWCDETVIPHPFEVLGYIKGADYVITDTFHGSVMSLKLNRPFAVLVRDSNQQKMTSLLSQFNLQSQIVADMNSLEIKLLYKIDYSSVNKVLKKAQIESLVYLNSHIQ
ncbi:polysaccharide pyruvyl transferase family protein [uncultured Bacteroides sp.]|uniref:polysaccharide pyruvyl transferase family protein n=1 Tax=uncultured Bacteroides sp. TaxID=162156 RepID=UPI00266E9962|nr:polysaccharide pyruvyl transferase family protein [uncultured Bacteroides sp.]